LAGGAVAGRAPEAVVVGSHLELPQFVERLYVENRRAMLRARRATRCARCERAREKAREGRGRGRKVTRTRERNAERE